MRVIRLPGSKGAQRKGFDECVLIHDPLAVRLISRTLARVSPDARLFPGTFRDLAGAIRRYAGDFGIYDSSLMPYCLRRGGATWHFAKYASLDATQSLGRWEHAKTAKIYINQAMSDSIAAGLSNVALQRVQRCKRLLAVLAADPPAHL